MQANWDFEEEFHKTELQGSLKGIKIWKFPMGLMVYFESYVRICPVHYATNAVSLSRCTTIIKGRRVYKFEARPKEEYP